MPPTQKPLPTSKKAQKYKYLTAGLKKIIKMKNKKLQNDITFHFYINVKLKNQPPTQNLRKTAKMTKKIFLGAAGLSQEKFWLRPIMILTCKSFVGYGYRGERLIELSSSWLPLKFPSG